MTERYTFAGGFPTVENSAGLVWALLTGVELGRLAVRRVPRTVNKVGSNGAQLLEPIGDEAGRPRQFALP